MIENESIGTMKMGLHVIFYREPLVINLSAGKVKVFRGHITFCLQGHS